MSKDLDEQVELAKKKLEEIADTLVREDQSSYLSELIEHLEGWLDRIEEENGDDAEDDEEETDQ